MAFQRYVRAAIAFSADCYAVPVVPSSIPTLWFLFRRTLQHLPHFRRVTPACADAAACQLNRSWTIAGTACILRSLPTITVLPIPHRRHISPDITRIPGPADITCYTRCVSPLPTRRQHPCRLPNCSSAFSLYTITANALRLLTLLSSFLVARLIWLYSTFSGTAALTATACGPPHAAPTAFCLHACRAYTCLVLRIAEI